MATQIDKLWTEMEKDVTAGTIEAGGWLLRLVRPAADCPLFVAIELGSRRRAVLLRMPVESFPSRRKWPRCKGLEPLVMKIEGADHFGVALKEERFADVFTALAEDLARRVSEAKTPADQARSFLGQLSRWQKFLSASMEGLTDEEQRGLWGELRFLRDHLIPVIGTSAVVGWKGPQQAHQDFQFESGAIEIKTTLAKQPQVVRITSERQLDESTWATLILFVSALDVRASGGEMLPALVASLRAALVTDPAAQEQLEDGLLLAGYMDVHADRYTEHGYLVRSETALHVRRGFPRLTERDLPAGVGDANYGLTVAACSIYALNQTAMEKTLMKMTKPARRRNRRNRG